jgi:hypothetical protein
MRQGVGPTKNNVRECTLESRRRHSTMGGLGRTLPGVFTKGPYRQPRGGPHHEPDRGQASLYGSRPGQATAGVEYRKDVNVIDEIPMAYKDIDAVMHVLW